jgi:hypothetical protein
MKYLVVLAVLAVLGFSGAALAEPISFASDSAPVTLDIACWVYLSFEGAEFNLDVEAGQGSAEDWEWLYWGHNCPIVLTGELTPPPGAPGQWDWGWWSIGTHEFYEYVPWAGSDPIGVQVSGIGIWDAAGSYPGGQLTMWVSCLDDGPQ